MDLTGEIKIKEEKEDPFDIKCDNINILQSNFDVKIKVENDPEIEEFWFIPSNFISQTYEESCGDAVAYNDLIQSREEECPFCDKIFFNNYSLIKHNLTHLRVEMNKLSTYECHVCNTKYMSKAKLNKHIKTEHRKRIKTKKDTINTTNPNVPVTKSLQQCNKCGKILPYKSWHSHVKEVHGEKYVTCNKCNGKFKCQRYLRRHMLYKHDGVRPIWRFRRIITDYEMACDICSSTFNNRNSLITHIRNCHSDTVYECPECGSKLKSKPYLQTHIRRVHYDDGQKYTCFCGKTFKSPRYLRVHYKNSGHGTLL